MLHQIIEACLLALWNGVGAGAGKRRGRPVPGTGEEERDVIGYQMDAENTPVRLTLDLVYKHLYLLGATGCGKTTLLLHLLRWYVRQRISFIVIDLRGDLIQRVLSLVADSVASEEIAGGRLLLLDMDAEEQIVPFNPLAGGGDLHTRSLALLGVLKHRAESWGVALDELLRFSLIALSQAGYSLLELEPFLTLPAFRAQVKARVSDPATLQFLARFDRLSAEQQLTQAQAVLNKATPFLTFPAFRCLFGAEQSLDFRTLLDTEPGRIVLISLAVHRYGEAAHTLGSMLVDAIQDAVLSRIHQPEATRLPVALVIDEFENLLTPRCMEGIAEGRRFREHLVLAHQNLAQLDRQTLQTILNNVQTQFYYRTGAMDGEALAREIDGDLPKEQIRLALMRQQVGECFLVRRGDRSVPMRVRPYTDPSVKEAQIQAVREASWNRYARPRAALEEELRERSRWLDSLASIEEPPRYTPKPGTKRHNETGDKPVVEVRDHVPNPKKPVRRPPEETGA